MSSGATPAEPGRASGRIGATPSHCPLGLAAPPAARRAPAPRRYLAGAHRPAPAREGGRGIGGELGGEISVLWKMSREEERERER